MLAIDPPEPIVLYNEAEEKRVALLIQQWEEKRKSDLPTAEMLRSKNTWLWFQPSPDDHAEHKPTDPLTLLRKLGFL